MDVIEVEDLFKSLGTPMPASDRRLIGRGGGP
jgi:hypothetical protein